MSMGVIYNAFAAIKKTNKHLQSALINFTAELVVFLTLFKQKKYCKYGSKVTLQCSKV